MKHRLSLTQKSELLEASRKGISVRTLCMKYHVPRSTAYRWIGLDRCEPNPRPQRSLRLVCMDLERTIVGLRHQLAILRELTPLSDAPANERAAAVANMKSRFSVKALCEALTLRKSTYYHHTRKHETKYVREDRIVSAEIAAIHADQQKRAGSVKIKHALDQRGYRVSVPRVQRLMREMNIATVRTNKPKPFYIKLDKTMRCENILSQHFSQPAPNLVWVSDITYVRVKKRFMYVCVILDLFSRRIIAHQVSLSMEARHVVECFKRAFQDRGRPTPLLFHSDRGSQYTSNEFRETLAANGIEQSFSGPGYPFHNAVAESFFASFKKETIQRYPQIHTAKQLKGIVDEHVAYHNEKRLHRGIGYLTPCQKEDLYTQSHMIDAVNSTRFADPLI